MRIYRLPLALLAVPIAFMSATAAPAPPPPPPAITPETAERFAALALRCIQQEYPNKLDHVMNDAGEVRGPRALHPAFYGCFDWHSSVHGHWMLVRLLRVLPGLASAAKIRAALGANLTAANIRTETAYFHERNRGSFERTYGWAWLLKLAEELKALPGEDARQWAANLQPLADEIVTRYLAFLPKQLYPIRTGVHPNTAFGLAFAWDYALAFEHTALRDLVAERARTYFAADRNYPALLEPSGADFFSPALLEADLMRRVLPGPEFKRWFAGFLPAPLIRQLAEPARVTDRTDLQIVHLDGLNLSRAWCLRALGQASGRRELAEAAERHAAAGLAGVTAGDYAGEHWLASFAVYLLTGDRP